MFRAKLINELAHFSACLSLLFMMISVNRALTKKNIKVHTIWINSDKQGEHVAPKKSVLRVSAQRPVLLELTFCFCVSHSLKAEDTIIMFGSGYDVTVSEL